MESVDNLRLWVVLWYSTGDDPPPVLPSELMEVETPGFRGSFGCRVLNFYNE